MKRSKHASHEKVSMNLVVHIGGGQVFLGDLKVGGQIVKADWKWGEGEKLQKMTVRWRQAFKTNKQKSSFASKIFFCLLIYW